MSPKPKTELLYCLRILEAIGKIKLYAAGYDNPFLFFDANDQKDFNACLLQLLHIGEQANRMSESTRERYPKVPWQTIRGFRNLIAHDYVGIDKLIVFETITTHLDQLRVDIEHIIRTGLTLGIFDNVDYQLSKESNYYRHIDFSTIS
jgi:uncharacterized protein with HEPN domain